MIFRIRHALHINYCCKNFKKKRASALAPSPSKTGRPGFFGYGTGRERVGQSASRTVGQMQNAFGQIIDFIKWRTVKVRCQFLWCSIDNFLFMSPIACPLRTFYVIHFINRFSIEEFLPISSNGGIKSIGCRLRAFH